MATKRYRGDYIMSQQVDTLTVGGTVESDDKFIVTMNGKALSVAAGSTVTTTVAATIAAALNASTIPEFEEITYAQVGSTIVCTADEGGKSFSLSVSTTEGDNTAADAQTFSRAATTANSGPRNWDQAANWSSSGVPVNADEVFIDSGEAKIAEGLDQSAVTLDELHVLMSFTGEIGMPVLNKDAGSEQEHVYYEYRETYLKISSTVINIGRGEGAGSGRIKLNVGTAQCALNVFDSGTQLEAGIPAILWKGTHASNTVEIVKGTLGIAFFPGETAAVTTLRIGFVENQQSDAEVTCGAGVTLTNIYQSGGKLTTESNITLKDQTDGEHFVLAGDITTLHLWNGTLHYRAGGTLTTVEVGNGGHLDFSQDLSPRTITNAVLMHAGSRLSDPFGTVTFSGGISLVGCKIGDVTLDVGNDRTLDVT